LYFSFTSNRRGFAGVIIAVIGFIASVIGIAAFVTGKNSIHDFFATRSNLITIQEKNNLASEPKIRTNPPYYIAKGIILKQQGRGGEDRAFYKVRINGRNYWIHEKYVNETMDEATTSGIKLVSNAPARPVTTTKPLSTQVRTTSPARTTSTATTTPQITSHAPPAKQFIRITANSGAPLLLNPNSKEVYHTQENGVIKMVIAKRGAILEKIKEDALHTKVRFRTLELWVNAQYIEDVKVTNPMETFELIDPPLRIREASFTLSQPNNKSIITNNKNEWQKVNKGSIVKFLQKQDDYYQISIAGQSSVWIPANNAEYLFEIAPFSSKNEAVAYQPGKVDVGAALLGIGLNQAIKAIK